MEDSVIVTGGYYSYTRVARYSEDGYEEDLPSLVTGRADHACGHFIDSKENMVRAQCTVTSTHDLLQGAAGHRGPEARLQQNSLH